MCSYFWWVCAVWNLCGGGGCGCRGCFNLLASKWLIVPALVRRWFNFKWPPTPSYHNYIVAIVVSCGGRWRYCTLKVLVNFCQVLSKFSDFLTWSVVCKKRMIFWQKFSMEIKSRLNFTIFWVFKCVFRYCWYVPTNPIMITRIFPHLPMEQI